MSAKSHREMETEKRLNELIDDSAYKPHEKMLVITMMRAQLDLYEMEIRMLAGTMGLDGTSNGTLGRLRVMFDEAVERVVALPNDD